MSDTYNISVERTGRIVWQSSVNLKVKDLFWSDGPPIFLALSKRGAVNKAKRCIKRLERNKASEEVIEV